ncbi:MAG: hypothetical protein JXQ90_20690 [Cyclobacteriaceae bacterium]
MNCKKPIILCFAIVSFQMGLGQTLLDEADSLKKQGLLVPALMKYASVMAQKPSPEVSYNIATTATLLWTSQMRYTAFFFLNYALQHDSKLKLFLITDLYRKLKALT